MNKTSQDQPRIPDRHTAATKCQSASRIHDCPSRGVLVLPVEAEEQIVINLKNVQCNIPVYFSRVPIRLYPRVPRFYVLVDFFFSHHDHKWRKVGGCQLVLGGK